MALSARVIRGAKRPFVVIPSVLVLAFALLVPMAGAALANHDTRTLQVTAETDDNAVGTTHTVTAHLRNATDTGDAPADGVSGTIEIDFEITGPNDPDTGDTPATPDMTCTVAVAAATCSPTAYSGPTTGVDTIRGWIDHDKNNVTVEADLTEGQNEATTPGAQTEPDTTDVSTKTWFTGLPVGAALDCIDEQADLIDDDYAANPVTGAGSDEVYTCTVADLSTTPDTPIAGAVIDVENLNGANDPDNSAAAGTADTNDACTTNASGECTITIAPIESQLGTAPICFWVDEDADTAFDPAGAQSDGGRCGEAITPDDTDLTDVVTKEWQTRVVSDIDVTPERDVNQTGTSHTATATVYDQFGDPVANVNVDFVVTGGRNNQTSLDRVTNVSGEVALTYTDAGAVGVAGSDTIRACTDNGTEDDDCGGALDFGEFQDTAQKDWITEAAVAADAAVDMLGCNGNLANLNDAAGGDAWDDEATNEVDNDHEVCASAATAGGEILYGHTITFASAGPGSFVDADGNDLGTTLDVVIGASGYASVDIYSLETGDQVITATIDGKTATGTKIWEADDSRNIDLEPETATNEPGTIHAVTATVTDRLGNGVPGVSVTFTETGPGTFRDGSSNLVVVTNASGVALAETTTLLSETGDQAISASIPSAGAGFDCDLLADDPNTGDPAGNCTDDVVKTWAEAPFCPGYEGDTRNQIVGTDAADVLVGTAERDIICGLGGDDELRGSTGRDVIKGGAGDDFMAGGGDNDTLLGGSGPDTAKGNAGKDTCKSAATKRSCEV